MLRSSRRLTACAQCRRTTFADLSLHPRHETDAASPIPMFPIFRYIPSRMGRGPIAILDELDSSRVGQARAAPEKIQGVVHQQRQPWPHIVTSRKFGPGRLATSISHTCECATRWKPHRTCVFSPAWRAAFARSARERLRLGNDGYRRDHLRALAQRVEVADDEVRIMGSKSELLRTLVAASSGQTAAFGVQSSVLKWRTRQDSNL